MSSIIKLFIIVLSWETLSKNFMINLGVSGYVSKQRSSGSQENKMKKHINNTLLKFILIKIQFHFNN
tara:strand:- start:583 stop:783 length:201 start_codon:yes stop_codon:yes gene_type:complete